MSGLFPQGLWVPKQKDVLGQFAPVQYVLDESTSSAATTVTHASPAIENDDVLIVTTAAVKGVADATQLALSAFLNIVDENENILCGIAGWPESGNAANRVLRGKYAGGNLILLGGQRLLASVNYDAGVQPNETFLTAHGFTIPRANWQR